MLKKLMRKKRSSTAIPFRVNHLFGFCEFTAKMPEFRNAVVSIIRPLPLHHSSWVKNAPQRFRQDSIRNRKNQKPAIAFHRLDRLFQKSTQAKPCLFSHSIQVNAVGDSPDVSTIIPSSKSARTSPASPLPIFIGWASSV